MAQTFDELTIPDDRCTVDDLLWRAYHREYPGLVEQVLALNRGLAALGVFPPVGTKVLVPTPDPGRTDTREIITLWTEPKT